MRKKRATEREPSSAVRSASSRFATSVAVALVLLSIIGLSRAGARLDEALLRMGERALAFPGAPAEQARIIELNGVSLTIRTQEVDAPIRAVVEYYRQRCATSERGDSSVVAAVRELSTASALRDGAGYVACVDIEAVDLESLVRSLDQFAHSWDLSHLGGTRYVYVRRSADHPTSSTFVFTMWVDGSFDLHELLPMADRDAVGADLAEFPRPPNAQRLIHVREQSKPSTVVAYLTRDAEPDEILKSYRSRLANRGWSFVEKAPHDSILVDGSRLLAVRKPGRLVSVIANRTDQGRAIVTLLETRLNR